MRLQQVDYSAASSAPTALVRHGRLLWIIALRTVLRENYVLHLRLQATSTRNYGEAITLTPRPKLSSSANQKSQERITKLELLFATATHKHWTSYLLP